MHRLLPRFAAALLCSASLAACSSMGMGGAGSQPARTAQSSDASQAGLPTDLDGEIRRAQLLRSQGSLDEAIKALGQLMLVAPDDPRVVAEYGKTLAQQDRSQEAVEFLTRAAQLAPNDWSVYSALGVAYDQQGDAANAKAAYERALALKPGDSVVLNNYALSRMLAGDLPAARRMIAQAAAADGADPKIARNVSYVANYGSPAASVAMPVASAGPVTRGVPVTPHATKPAGMAMAATAPRPLNANVVMQAVPNDPLAGPVAKRAKHVASKPVSGHPTVAKKDKAPALRMSADAS